MSKIVEILKKIKYVLKCTRTTTTVVDEIIDVYLPPSTAVEDLTWTDNPIYDTDIGENEYKITTYT